MSKPLEDYGLISNCLSAALVGRDGSIDWLCLPCFDSAACFASLLGNKENGRWQISPSGDYQVSRQYVEGTMVLETIFKTDQGSCKLTDCMLINEDHPTLVRSIQGLTGSIDLHMEFIVRFDYGNVVPWVRRNKNCDGIHAIAGPDGLVLYSPICLQGENLHTVGRFTCHAGDEFNFTIRWYDSHTTIPANITHPNRRIQNTVEWWKKWSNQSTYQGFDSKSVERSLITLKGLTYHPTGAIVAAPTTSLPESLGGHRNWDYRFGWIRDSSFTLMALLRAGYRDEAARWNDWLLRAVAGTSSQLNIMYGIRAERRLTEIELPWLDGYENSRPVRIGNDAYRQFQLDVYGELVATGYVGRHYGLKFNEDAWRIEANAIKYICEHWTEPDEGIWEVRGKSRQFTHSKLMAWVALKYAVESVEKHGVTGDIKYWKIICEKIHQDICTNGFDRSLNSFVQYYGSKELDASLLMMGLVGFLPMDDPRIIGTVEAIKKHLSRDDFLLRYLPNPEVDGLTGSEGSFIPCTFWLVRNLSLMGKKEEAMELYEKLCSIRNDLGLFAEEYSSHHKRMVGNYPQAFTHISQINAAMDLNRIL